MSLLTKFKTWLKMGFKAHCEALGINLSNDDIKLIKWRIRQLSAITAKEILDTYVKIWLDIRKEEERQGNVIANSLGRHFANYYLRTLKKGSNAIIKRPADPYKRK